MKETAIILKEKGIMSTLEDRSAERRKRIVANRAFSHEEAETWDLDYWQQLGPESRLSALVAIHEDVELAQSAHTAATRGRD